MTTKKTGSKSAGKKAAKKASESNATGSIATGSMPKAGKDPQGGLTAKGRAYFAKKEGLHLRPGVQGPADTPEKMVRKGSFLRRHFAHPRGPMKDEKGEPTRLALSAHAWGEDVPQTATDAKRLAEEGHELLEQYHEIKEAGGSGSEKRKSAAKKPSEKPAAAKKAAARGSSVGSGKNTVSKKGSAKLKANRTTR